MVSKGENHNYISQLSISPEREIYTAKFFLKGLIIIILKAEIPVG